MEKLQIIIGALAIYGMLTIGVSFFAWINSSTWGGYNEEDACLGNFWKWGVIIVMIITLFCFIVGPTEV